MRRYYCFDDFCGTDAKTVSVGLVGVGAIGSSLLGLLVEQREVLRTQFHLDLQIRAVANADKVPPMCCWILLCSFYIYAPRNHVLLTGLLLGSTVCMRFWGGRGLKVECTA